MFQQPIDNAITSIILGVIGLILMLVSKLMFGKADLLVYSFAIVYFLPALIGVILGIKGFSKPERRKLATAGILISSIVLLAAIYFLGIVSLFSLFGPLN